MPGRDADHVIVEERIAAGAVDQSGQSSPAGPGPHASPDQERRQPASPSRLALGRAKPGKVMGQLLLGCIRLAECLSKFTSVCDTKFGVGVLQVVVHCAH